MEVAPDAQAWATRIESALNAQHQARASGFLHAVARLIRQAGAVTPEAEGLFRLVADASSADPEDLLLFVEHGLVAPPK